MPRRIEQSTLDAIGAKHVKTDTQSLLDNTLNTLKHKAAMREADQVHALRSRQIQAADNELREYQLNDANREAERELLAQRNEFLKENQGERLQWEQAQLENQYAQSEFEGMQANYNMVINAGTNVEKNQLLSNMEGMLSPERIEALRNVNWDNTKAKRAYLEENTILDIPYLQDLAKQRAASTTSMKISSPPYTAQLVTDQLKNATDLTAEHVAGVNTLVRDIATSYKDRNVDVKISDTVDAAIQLLRADPDKYVSEEGGFLGFGADELMHKDVLREDIEAMVETRGMVRNGSRWRQAKYDNPDLTPAQILQDLIQLQNANSPE